MQPRDQAPVVLSMLSIISAVIGLPALALRAFEWQLIVALAPFLTPATPFLMPVVYLQLAIIYAALIPASVIFLFCFRKSAKRVWVPAAINVPIALVLVFFPFTNTWLKAQFSLHREKYAQVASLIEAGAMEPNERGLLSLPSEYAGLSKEAGEVLVSRKDGTVQVLFYTFRGALDSCSGFVYVSNGNPPDNSLGDWVQVIRMAPGWFFCASQ